MTPTQFNTVWLPLQGRFYRMAYYMLENEADAKDAVQDLYLKLWNLKENLEIVREPSSYGALMLKNLCIDYIRRRRPSEALLENMAVNDPLDRELDLKEDLQTLAKAIEQLPPRQQRLIRLRFIRGLSYEEIEQETGLSGLNIRVQVSLARKKLKQLL